MKKIIAIVLAVVMIAAMSVTVFAAEGESAAATKKLADKNNAAASENVEVKYTSAQGYEVIIPGEFNLVEGTEANAGIATGSGEVKATKAKINAGKKLIVTVTSANSWFLKDTTSEGADDIAYSVAIVNTADNGGIAGALGSDGKVLEYTSNADTWTEKVSTMNLTTAYSNQAGSFLDTLTFKAEVK